MSEIGVLRCMQRYEDSEVRLLGGRYMEILRPEFAAGVRPSTMTTHTEKHGCAPLN